MDKIIKYDAVIDLSGGEVAFAVKQQDVAEALLVKYRQMRGRSAALLLEWLQESLQKIGLELTDIARWTVGSGPGSFTGLRMAASLVSGLIFGKDDVRARCLPTAVGLAAGIDSCVGEKIAVLFDGRNQELLLFGVKRDESGLTASGVTEVLDAGSAENFCGGFDRLVAFERDRGAVENILSANMFEKTEFVEHLPVAEMLNIETDNWNNDLTDLVYIRQAVFTKPISK